MRQCNLRTMTQQGNSNCTQYASGDCTQWNKPVAHNHSAVPSAIAYNRASYIVRNATSMTVHYKSAAIARNAKSMIARKQASNITRLHAINRV